VASRRDAFAIGDAVTTLSGFQDYVIIRDDSANQRKPKSSNSPAVQAE
jgi:hypothetical protein